LSLDEYRRTRLSKLMSFILRHSPESVGLKLDEGGWVSIDELVEAIKTRWRNREAYQWLRPEHVLEVVARDPKGRFEVRDGRIRARYGHNRSVRVSIDYPRYAGTEPLYHGTSRRSLARILTEGIKPMNRKFVHLTLSVDEACRVGARHGEPVVLQVDVECLRREGYEILDASHVVKLVEYVPPKCISRVIDCAKGSTRITHGTSL